MPKMLLHELHPAVIHMPLALLPTATVADVIAVATGDQAWAKVGRRLWVAGTLSALFSGVAGLAASQEVKLDEPRARDMVFLHGLGNALITVGAVGVTLWRLARPPSLGQCLVGLAANAAVGAWWLDPLIGLFIAFVAVKEGREAWQGEGCAGCTSPLASTATVRHTADDPCCDDC